MKLPVFFGGRHQIGFIDFPWANEAREQNSERPFRVFHGLLFPASALNALYSAPSSANLNSFHQLPCFIQAPRYPKCLLLNGKSLFVHGN